MVSPGWAGFGYERETFLSGYLFNKMTEIPFFTENNEGDTPLMIAEEKNFDDCIELVSSQELKTRGL